MQIASVFLIAIETFLFMRPDCIRSKFGPDCAMRHVLCGHRVHLINRNRKFSFNTTDPPTEMWGPTLSYISGYDSTYWIVI